jgi:hypothetical protein
MYSEKAGTFDSWENYLAWKKSVDRVSKLNIRYNTSFTSEFLKNMKGYGTWKTIGKNPALLFSSTPIKLPNLDTLDKKFHKFFGVRERIKFTPKGTKLLFEYALEIQVDAEQKDKTGKIINTIKFSKTINRKGSVSYIPLGKISEKGKVKIK